MGSEQWEGNVNMTETDRMETEEVSKKKYGKVIGKSAVGSRKDTTYRRSYYEDFPRGWKTVGIITKYDIETHKYLIEGENYIFNETGEFRVDGSGDWYSRDQIRLDPE